MAIAKIPPLVRGAFGEAVLRQAMHAAMIDVELIEDPDCFIPHVSMSQFIAEAARRSGDDLLGLRIVPHLRVSDYGCWGAYVLGAETLGEAVGRARRSIGYHSRGDRIGFAVEDGRATLRYRSAARGREGYAQVAAGIVGVMLSLFHAYCRPPARPRGIELDLPVPRDGDLFGQVFGAPVRFGAPDLALVFDAALLLRRATPHPVGRLLTLEDVANARSEPSSRETLGGSAAALVRTQVLAGEVSLDRTAQLLGTSTRTLQRELNGLGTDFRSLVNLARVARAKRLLAETGRSVTEISAELGYSAPAHFARAFRRETGLAPLNYRTTRQPAAAASGP